MATQDTANPGEVIRATTLTTSPVSAGQTLICCLVVSIVILWGLRLMAGDAPPVFPTDDAYITLHNAATLHRGHDDNYIGVPASAGATSTVHLALVAFLHLFVSLPVGSYLVSIAAASLYAVGILRLAYRAGLSSGSAAVLTGIGLLSAYVPFHLFNGLETGLAMAAVLWALLLADAGSRVMLPLLCGLMPFIRPELGALAVALLAWRGWTRWSWTRDLGSTAQGLVADGALVAAAALPWLLWLWLSTGALLPLTVSAKRAFFADDKDLLRSTLEIFRHLAASGTLLVVPLLIAARGVPLRPALAFFVGAFTAAYAHSFPSGLEHNYCRYTYTLFPAFIYLLAYANIPQKYLHIGALIALILFPFYRWGHQYSTYTFAYELADVAEWARDNLSEDARVLIHDAGYIAYATDFHLTDMVGLKAPASIEQHRRWTAPSGGHDRHEAIARIAADSKPTHAIILKDGGFWGELATSLERHHWELRPLRVPADDFGYVIYHLTPPMKNENRRDDPQPATTKADED